MDPLTLELLSWIARHPRSYAETMEAWRSNCPRHSVWEDALIDGLVQVVGSSDRVILTAAGKSMIECGIRLQPSTLP